MYPRPRVPVSIENETALTSWDWLGVGSVGTLYQGPYPTP